MSKGKKRAAKSSTPAPSQAPAPARQGRLMQACAALIVGLAVVDLFLKKKPYFFSVETWPGFFALLGLAGCVAMMGVAHLIGAILRRDENYYE